MPLGGFDRRGHVGTNVGLPAATVATEASATCQAIATETAPVEIVPRATAMLELSESQAKPRR